MDQTDESYDIPQEVLAAVESARGELPQSAALDRAWMLAPFYEAAIAGDDAEAAARHGAAIRRELSFARACPTDEEQRRAYRRAYKIKARRSLGYKPGPGQMARAPRSSIRTGHRAVHAVRPQRRRRETTRTRPSRTGASDDDHGGDGPDGGDLSAQRPSRRVPLPAWLLARIGPPPGDRRLAAFLALPETLQAAFWLHVQDVASEAWEDA